MEKLPEILWKTYDDISGWVRFSDTKAAAILASNVAILVIVFSKSIDGANFLLDHKMLLLFLAMGFLFGLASIYYAMCCLNPMFDPGEPKSLIYFAHIARKYNNYDKYNIDVTKAFKNESEISSQIAYQVWTNSKIALKKYNSISWSIRFFIGLILFFVLAGIELMHISISQYLNSV